jgi:hypothetical protein
MATIFNLDDVQRNESPEIDVGQVLGRPSLKGLKLRYRLYRDTHDSVRQVLELEDAEDKSAFLDLQCEHICRDVAEWNLAYNGEVVALDPEVVAERVPPSIRMAVQQAIATHSTPPEKSGRRR